MKFQILVLALIMIGCSAPTDQTNNTTTSQKTTPITAASDTELTPKVTGIGGIFFKSKTPNDLKNWYSEQLGLAVNEYGSAFEFRNTHSPYDLNYLNWSPVKEGTEFFAPSEMEFMINYRVQNMDGLIKKLRANGVTIVDGPTEFSYGKFAHILDPEGYKIELWEPIDSVLTAIGSETTK